MLVSVARKLDEILDQNNLQTLVHDGYGLVELLLMREVSSAECCDKDNRQLQPTTLVMILDSRRLC